jgi:hypothetical protein
MIAKINTGSNLHGTLLYNWQKVEDGEAQVLCVNEIWEPLSGRYKVQDFISAFNMRLAVNNRTEKPIVHISLNPSPKDIVSDENYQQIAQEYMERMGFGAQPYVVFKHEDIERHHIHIVTTNLKFDGSKLNESYSHMRSKVITNDLERKFHLQPADIKQDNKQWLPNKVDPARGRLRYQIKNVAKHLLDNYKFGTLNEFRSALALYNVDLQDIKGELKNGKTYPGIIYSAANDDGVRIAAPLKSSLLGKDYGLAAIEKKIAASLTALKSMKRERVRTIISQTVAQSSSREEFTAQLRESGIDIYFRSNEAGRIYGATIIDHNAKVVVNGSKLGKEFSANAFHALFEQWTSAAPQTDCPTKEKTKDMANAATSLLDANFAPNDYGIGAQKTDYNNNETTDKQSNNNIDTGIAAGLIGTLFDIPQTAMQRYIPEHKRRKKKKKITL